MTYEEMIEHMTHSEDAQLVVQLGGLLSTSLRCDACRMTLVYKYDREKLEKNNLPRLKGEYEMFKTQLAFAQQIFRSQQKEL